MRHLTADISFEAGAAFALIVSGEGAAATEHRQALNRSLNLVSEKLSGLRTTLTTFHGEFFQKQRLRSVLDRDSLLARVGHDSEFLRTIIDIFREECPKRLQEIRTALKTGDATQLRQAAHTAKGTFGNVGGQRASESALAVESLSRKPANSPTARLRSPNSNDTSTNCSLNSNPL